MGHCFGYCYCCLALQMTPVVLSLIPTTTTKMTNLAVFSSRSCFCRQHFHESGNLQDAAAEYWLDAHVTLDCPEETPPVSYMRNQDRMQVHMGTEQRKGCGGEDCTGKDAPADMAGRDALLNQVFHPSARS